MASALLAKGISFFLFVFMSILIIVTFLQVFFRFVVHFPAVWTEEVARMSFAWLIFLGSAVAVREGTHLTLDMLAAALPPRLRSIPRYWVLFLVLALSGVVSYAGASYCVRSAGKTAVTLPIPSNCVYLAVPVSGTIMIFFALEKLISFRAGKGEAEA
ncbi:MAG: TRAP transporter small permease [Planctomycetota bacterium]|jgi:TRAP-type C4-dicarboxylate transport system permease small subunit|nr:TRAP transporter small permease [Planctomycetota bacterium]